MSQGFDIKIQEDHGQLYLSVTHNGYQWTSLPIRDAKYEIPKIIEVLQEQMVLMGVFSDD